MNPFEVIAVNISPLRRVLALPLLLLALAGSAHAVEVTDVLGRKVEVPAEPKRVVLGEDEGTLVHV